MPDEVNAWVEKAEGDLRSSRHLFRLVPPESDSTAYHAQQAVEKYLKAVLVQLELEPPRTHDLILLIDILIGEGIDVHDLRDVAQPLSPLAVRARYPFGQSRKTRHRTLWSAPKPFVAQLDRFWKDFADRRNGVVRSELLPHSRLLVSRPLRSVDDPERDEVLQYAGLAHAKDMPLLVCALCEDCPLLVTFSMRDYQPGHPDVEVRKPGALVRRIRARLTGL